ncbi:IS66 family insertion sequence element accessory protein TnpA [Lysinibacillus fusiformis]
MTQSERQAMWQDRIAAFRASGETNVSAWCAQQNISVNCIQKSLHKL